MKKRGKICLVALLALALLLSLTGCGGPETPEKVMEKAEENLEKIDSMSFEIGMTMGLSAMGESLDMAITMDGAATKDPEIAYTNLSLDMGTLGSMEMEMYMETEGDTVTTYTGSDGSWTKETGSADEMDLGNDASENMAAYLSLASTMTENGVETIDGVEATRYDGAITEENLQDAIDSLGIMGELGSELGLDAEAVAEAEESLSGIGDIPVSIWIDKEKMLPLRYEMDMTAVMQQIVENAMEGALDTAESGSLISVSEMRVTIALGDFDSVGEIVIPEEAKNAA